MEALKIKYRSINTQNLTVIYKSKCEIFSKSSYYNCCYNCCLMESVINSREEEDHSILSL